MMYLPYSVATMIMSAMYFIIMNMILSKSVSNVSWGGTLTAMLGIGLVLMSIFTVGYMLYINSFLIKRRKKEFGLYGILGLEKRHVSRIVRNESLLLDSVSLATGLLCGTVFGRLIFMLLMLVSNIAPDSTFELSPAAYLITAAVFIGIFIVCTIYNQMQVRLANPIDLINGEKKGEKKQRFVALKAIFGVLCLGGAYFFSVTVSVGSYALLMFWPAVLLVIIGTYLLFTAGSQYILAAMKKNEKFYYKPRNFVTVSSMTHRMKQNASGLSNICILCTMVLVTVSGVCSLYFGQESILREQNPSDFSMEMYYDRRLELPDMTETKDAVYALADENNVEVQSIRTYNTLRDVTVLHDGEFRFKDESAQLDTIDVSELNSLFPLYMMTEADYTAVTGEKLELSAGQLVILTDKPIKDTERLDVNGKSYAIKQIIPDSSLVKCKNGTLDNGIFFIVDSKQSLEQLRYDVNPGLAQDALFGEFYATLMARVDYDGSEQNRLAFAHKLDEVIYEKLSPSLSGMSYSVDDINISREESHSTFGGLLFLGIYFAVLFIVNTVIIMYFKQVSEGFEDRERFVILQKVGMSDDEVKKTINRQVLIVFFLPLIGSLINILAASNMITKILEVFVMYDFGVTLAVIAITSIVFSIIYILVFKSTAKTYYKLVKW